MKFVTNRISTGSAKSFDDIIKEYQKNKAVKVAASAAAVKTAEQDEADSSGQLDVEPLHQKGESTTMPKAGPSAKTEGVDGKEGGKETTATDTCPEKDGDDSEQPKWEGKQENNNKPEVLEDAKGGSSKAKTKKAALEDLPQAVQDKIKGKSDDDKSDDDKSDDDKSDDDEDNKESSDKKEDKEEKEASDQCSKCNCDPCECEKEASDKNDDKEEKEAGACDCGKDDCDECSKKCAEKDEEEKNDEKKESSSVKFVKIANLNAKNKGFLREYWTKLYGEDYVSALLADK